jgi:hypothetical protein
MRCEFFSATRNSRKLRGKCAPKVALQMSETWPASTWPNQKCPTWWEEDTQTRTAKFHDDVLIRGPDSWRTRIVPHRLLSRTRDDSRLRATARKHAARCWPPGGPEKSAATRQNQQYSCISDEKSCTTQGPGSGSIVATCKFTSTLFLLCDD